MCERSELFLLEPKSILLDLLTRSWELFDLSIHFIEHDRLDRFFSQRHQNFSTSPNRRDSCQLNYSLQSDLDTFLQRLQTSCRVTKNHLRALHAARLTSSTDYIVLDEHIDQSIRSFQSKLNRFRRESPSIDEDFRSIFVSFEKISQFFRLLLHHFYGVHRVRDSHLLQPMVISIIRLLLLISHHLKQRIE